MKRVIIIGANLGGLTAAVLLGRAGWDVTLFEQKSRDGIGSPWVENMDLSVFDRLELDLPPADCYRKKKNWAFLSPSEDTTVVAFGPEESGEVLVDRQKLTDYLLSLAEITGKVQFDAKVTELVVDSGHVSGVRVDGQFYGADLTIDCSSVFSELRQQLPKFYGISPAPDRADMIHMVRSFYEWGDGAAMPKYTNKMYLRQGGSPRFSWCVSDVRDYCADVLVAKKGEVTEADIEETVEALRPGNPIIGAPDPREHADALTPVRQIISKMVVPGYVILGSTPSMTVPLLTPPLSDTMDAARILAEVLAVNDSCETDDLYIWQVRYCREYIAKQAAADVFRAFLLQTDPEDQDFLFVSEIIDGDFLSDLLNGDLPSITSKGRGFFGMGVKKPAVVNELRATLLQMEEAYNIVRDIPDVYNKTTFKKWQNDLESLIQ
ncbi:MAG: tryptophan 7-halogenase [Clostridia bacterium]|nr:tryptophan 7-halogenase [Clostridia bacterium]